MRAKHRISQFSSKLRLDIFNRSLEFRPLDALPHQKQIYPAVPITDENPRDNDELELSKPAEPLEHIFRRKGGHQKYEVSKFPQKRERLIESPSSYFFPHRDPFFPALSNRISKRTFAFNKPDSKKHREF